MEGTDRGSFCNICALGIEVSATVRLFCTLAKGTSKNRVEERDKKYHVRRRHMKSFCEKGEGSFFLIEIALGQIN